MKYALTKKIGRNTPCPCNSGKKYKKCCGKGANVNATVSRSDKAAAISRAAQLLQSGHYDKAYELCQFVLNAEPNNIAAIQLSGNIFIRTGRYDNAADLLERAISLNPNQADLYHQLGNVRKSQQRINDAIECISKAIAIDPKCAEAYINRANGLGMQGLIEEAIADYKKALSLKPELELARMNLLFMLNFSSEHTDADIVDEHRKFGESIEHGFSIQSEYSISVRHNNERLRIGYMSSDFYTHSVAYYIGPVLENHDHSKFETFAYYTNSINDDYTERLKNHCDNWRNVSSLNDQALEALIHKDEIDILVDLSGYTANSRIQVFARKPAPVQIAWIGYPNTTGLSRMDYRLTDKVADPVGMEDLYTEKLYRLPENFSVYQPPEECPDVVDPPCVNSGVITFGSFNNFSKTNPSVIKLWSRLLSEIPDSKLLLKNAALGDKEMQERVRNAFLEFGINKERLILLGSDPEKCTHFERYGQVDIGLDPFPYNGTTTTCEALWMGVPVVTLTGTSHRARVGTSLLTHLGRQEWIAETIDEYVLIARKLASDCGILRGIRQKLRTEMQASPLTDAETFTVQLEKAYRDIWGKTRFD